MAGRRPRAPPHAPTDEGYGERGPGNGRCGDGVANRMRVRELKHSPRGQPLGGVGGSGGRSPRRQLMEGFVAQGLVKWFKHRKVVDDVSLDIQRAEVVGLLGPNGAGKTTSFYMMVGLLPTDGGRIFLEGQETSSLPMHQRCRLGLGLYPQTPPWYGYLRALAT